jgi:hypothetical protein
MRFGLIDGEMLILGGEGSCRCDLGVKTVARKSTKLLELIEKFTVESKWLEGKLILREGWIGIIVN